MGKDQWWWGGGNFFLLPSAHPRKQKSWGGGGGGGACQLVPMENEDHFSPHQLNLMGSEDPFFWGGGVGFSVFCP